MNGTSQLPVQANLINLLAKGKVVHVYVDETMWSS